MNRVFKIVLLVSIFVSIAQNDTTALTIVSPTEGEVVYAGSSLTIKVKPDPGEKWENVAFGFYPMTYNPLTDRYTYTVSAQ